MPTPATLTRFVGSLRRLDYTRGRMEELYGRKRIVLRDLHSVYEALFLRAVTSFEVFLEDLFVSILTNKVRYSRTRVSVRMTAISTQALMDVLLQGQNYMAWLPFGRTEDRAKIYLKDGRPFTELTDSDKSVIRTITTIRNAIAHGSTHATSEFKRTVIGSRTLLPIERKPAGFLRSTVRTAPTRNQFEVYVGELARIAAKLC
jgi:hypothetical protein